MENLSLELNNKKAEVRIFDAEQKNRRDSTNLVIQKKIVDSMQSGYELLESSKIKKDSELTAAYALIEDIKKDIKRQKNVINLSALKYADSLINSIHSINTKYQAQTDSILENRPIRLNHVEIRVMNNKGTLINSAKVTIEPLIAAMNMTQVKSQGPYHFNLAGGSYKITIASSDYQDFSEPILF